MLSLYHKTRISTWLYKTHLSLSGLSTSIQWTSISQSLHFGSTDAISDNQFTQLWTKTWRSCSRKSQGILKMAWKRAPRCCARLATRMSMLSSNVYKRMSLTFALKNWSHHLKNLELWFYHLVNLRICTLIFVSLLHLCSQKLYIPQ